MDNISGRTLGGPVPRNSVKKCKFFGVTSEPFGDALLSDGHLLTTLKARLVETEIPA